jgi:hypothetical protein
VACKDQSPRLLLQRLACLHRERLTAAIELGDGELVAVRSRAPNDPVGLHRMRPRARETIAAVRDIGRGAHGGQAGAVHDRLAAAHVPAAVRFATRPRLAVGTIERAVEAGVPFAPRLP